MKISRNKLDLHEQAPNFYGRRYQILIAKEDMERSFPRLLYSTKFIEIIEVQDIALGRRMVLFHSPWFITSVSTMKMGMVNWKDNTSFKIQVSLIYRGGILFHNNYKDKTESISNHQKKNAQIRMADKGKGKSHIRSVRRESLLERALVLDHRLYLPHCFHQVPIRCWILNKLPTLSSKCVSNRGSSAQ